MFRTRVVIGWALLSAAVAPLNAQQYTIATYAGGAPALPVSAISLAADAAGNVYFVDGYGFGIYGSPALSSSVFKIDPSGSVTRLAGNSRTSFSGDGGPAISSSLNAPRAVAVDSSGNVFIVDAGNQRVRKVSHDGTITTVAGGGSAVLGDGGPATSGQLNYPNSIAVDSTGNLFIGEYGRVRKVSRDGIITTIAGGGPNDPDSGGPATSAQLSSVAAVAVDAAGDIFIADENENDSDDDAPAYVIRKISPDGTISSLPPTQFCCVGMIADAAGNLFIPNGSAIGKISPGGAQTTVAGNTSYGLPSGDGGPATNAQLNGPTAIALDPAGNLYIADNLGRSVRKITTDGIIRAFASIMTSAPLPSGDGGPATSAQLQLAAQGLSQQSGLAVDRSGNLYIAETAAHRVRKVSPSGTIATVAGVGSPRCSGNPSTCLPLGDGGPATSAALSFPTSVAVDGAGNLFIADSANARVRKVSSDGTITTVAGNGNASLQRGSGDGGAATNTSVVPFGVAVDPAGNLFISEGNYADVRKVSTDGTITTAFSINGFMSAATVDAAGNLLVAGGFCDDISCYDSIRKIASGGTATVIAGAANPSVFGNGTGDGGPAINAQLGFTSNIAVDAAGNIFLTDLIGARIRKIDANGIINTVGGDGVPGYSGDGGPATKATIDYPFGLATDAAGNLYLSDFNQAVRILRPVGQ